MDDAVLARMTRMLEGSQSGGAGVDWGILKADVNLENTLKVLGWLRNRIAEIGVLGCEAEISHPGAT